MIVLNVTYKCKPDKREEFLEMIYAEGIDVASRAEAGNIVYDYYIPTEGGDDLFCLKSSATKPPLPNTESSRTSQG